MSGINKLCALPGECQWLIKQFSEELEEVVDGINRQEGYSACSSIFPGLRVSDVMDLVRVHGYALRLRVLERDLHKSLL